LYQKIFPIATPFLFRAARNGRGTAHVKAVSPVKLLLNGFFYRKRLSAVFFRLSFPHFFIFQMCSADFLAQPSSAHSFSVLMKAVSKKI